MDLLDIEEKPGFEEISEANDATQMALRSSGWKYASEAKKWWRKAQESDDEEWVKVCNARREVLCEMLGEMHAEAEALDRRHAVFECDVE